MLAILQDAQRVPRIFCDFGAIPPEELREWLRHNALQLPADLIEFWELTGGGDIFDCETIYRPTVPSIPNSCFVHDDIESINAGHTAKGKPSEFYIFHDTGSEFSAVRLHDQKFVTLSSNYIVRNSFDSLDEWYIRTLRDEYGEMYGLVASETVSAIVETGRSQEKEGGRWSNFFAWLRNGIRGMTFKVRK